MVFSDTSGRTGIVEDTSWLIFGDSEDHISEYPLKDVARNVNRWYDRTVSLILQSDSRWTFDDNNKTDLPIGNVSLVSGQQDYTVSAATFLKIIRIDARDSSGNNVPLQPFTLDQLRGQADADFQSTAGVPQYYRLQGNSVFLYPKPNYSRTATTLDWGLRIFYQRNVDYFVYTDTTKVPGFVETFHRLLSLGAAYEYALTNTIKDKLSFLNDEITKMQNDLIDFYSKRNEDDKPALRLRKNDYGEMALRDGMAGGQDNNPLRFF